MSGYQINPKLIHALTNELLDNIPASPTFKHLGGMYVKAIVDNLKKLESPQPKNEMTMKCEQCGRSGKYNIGLVAIDISENSQKHSQQLTGYFRCKYCNAGGPWANSVHLSMLAMTSLIAPNRNIPVHFGEICLFDGYKPPYATDGEEHYLQLISADPTNSLLWNKLGNLYFSGSRPELAMAAFEKSIAIDPNQLESHLSIANILMQLKKYKEAIHHYHQMMIAAEAYPHLDAKQLRKLLAHGICSSFIAATKSKNKYEPLPTQEQLLAAGSSADLQSDQLPEYLNLSSEKISTFYPLAEVFMGVRKQELSRKRKKKQSPQKGTKSQQVELFIHQQKGNFTKTDIQQAYPDISLATITKVIRELRKANVIEMKGTGADIQWYKK